MAASNTRFTQNSLGQSKTPIDSDHGIYRVCRFCCGARVWNWHFATHSAAIKSRPLWRRTGNERTHGLSHLDAICLALDLTVSNVVHPSTVHRQHLRRNPT